MHPWLCKWKSNRNLTLLDSGQPKCNRAVICQPIAIFSSPRFSPLFWPQLSIKHTIQLVWPYLTSCTICCSFGGCLKVECHCKLAIIFSPMQCLVLDSLVHWAGVTDELDFAKRLSTWSSEGFPELDDTEGFVVSNTITKVIFVGRCNLHSVKSAYKNLP